MRVVAARISRKAGTGEAGESGNVGERTAKLLAE